MLKLLIVDTNPVTLPTTLPSNVVATIFAKRNEAFVVSIVAEPGSPERLSKNLNFLSVASLNTPASFWVPSL